MSELAAFAIRPHTLVLKSTSVGILGTFCGRDCFDLLERLWITSQVQMIKRVILHFQNAKMDHGEVSNFLNNVQCSQNRVADELGDGDEFLKLQYERHIEDGFQVLTIHIEEAVKGP
jgi:hypothetical protein